VSTNPYPSEWLRGVLVLAVQRVLLEGPTYGYAVAVALEEQGLGSIKGGTLYPLLTRLEDAGLVTVEWRAGEGGPGRKFYALTDAGREEFHRESAAWAAFASHITSFVTTHPQTGADR
jgi:PadR family transcriptional regulator PadR